MLTLTLSEPVEEMAVAYFIVHARQGNFFNEGEPALPYCFIFLLLAVAGGGKPGVSMRPLPPNEPPLCDRYQGPILL
jgi:hypothetical protein